MGDSTEEEYCNVVAKTEISCPCTIRQVTKNILYEKDGVNRGFESNSGVKLKARNQGSHQKEKCNSPIFQTTYALQMC